MEILRRIDRGYKLIDQAKDKSERLMNIESIKKLKHELEIMGDEENLIRVQADEVRNRLVTKEKQLAEIEEKLLSIVENMYESEQQNAKILVELKNQEQKSKDKKIELEEDMMKEFSLIEKYSKELNVYKSKYNRIEKLYNSKKISQHEKVAYLEDKIKLMEKKIRKLRKGTDPELLKIYDKKRQSTKIVFSKVVNGMCELCHMTLSTSLIEKIVNGDQFTECDCCNRILYLEEIEKDVETL